MMSMERGFGVVAVADRGKLGTESPAPLSQAAFFDFDRTLIHGDAGMIFGRTLVAWAWGKAKAESTRRRRAWMYLRIVWGTFSLLVQEVVFRSLHLLRIIKRSRLVQTAYSRLKGFPAAEMAQRMEEVWHAKLVGRIYPDMQKVIEDHRAKGHRVVIVTTGLKPLVTLVQRNLGAMDVIACTMGEHEGLWTGIVEGPLWGEHKADAVREYAAAHGIDLRSSYAYSDHYSDAPFLAAVGNPVAVNPDRRLRKLARRRGWTIKQVQPA